MLASLQHLLIENWPAVINLLAMAICLARNWKWRERLAVVSITFFLQMLFAILAPDNVVYYVLGMIVDAVIIISIKELGESEFHHDLMMINAAACLVSFVSLLCYFYRLEPIYTNVAMWLVFAAQVIRMLKVTDADRKRLANFGADSLGRSPLVHAAKAVFRIAK